MSGLLDGRVAVVTGASRGIGAACAKALAAEGATVAVVYHAKEMEALAVVAEIHGRGGQAQAFAADVADEASVRQLAGSVSETFGRVQILVNNAGVIGDKPLPFLAPEEWRSVLAVNATGAFLCLRAFAGPMGESGWGRIVNISSVAAQLGDAGRAHYAASKGALLGLTRSAAREWAGRGVTVNAVAPGFVETEMLNAMPDGMAKTLKQRIPLGRFATPDEIAQAVLFLCRPDAAYITGATLNIDGGLAIG